MAWIPTNYLLLSAAPKSFSAIARLELIPVSYRLAMDVELMTKLQSFIARKRGINEAVLADLKKSEWPSAYFDIESRNSLIY